MTDVEKNLFKTLGKVLKEIKSDEGRDIKNVTRELSDIELRDTFNYSIMNSLDTQNEIQETKDFINNAMELKKKNIEEFIRINNEMLEILRLEEEAKAKIRALKNSYRSE